MTAYRWQVSGSQAGYRGTLNPGYEDSGTVEAETVPEVVVWLLERGPVWDNLDAQEPLRITVEPVDPV